MALRFPTAVIVNLIGGQIINVLASEDIVTLISDGDPYWLDWLESGSRVADAHDMSLAIDPIHQLNYIKHCAHLAQMPEIERYSA